MSKKLVKTANNEKCKDCKEKYSYNILKHICNGCAINLDCGKYINQRLGYMYCSSECKLKNKQFIKQELSQLSILDRVIYEAKRMYSKLFKS